jgi:hypothetical protein
VDAQGTVGTSAIPKKKLTSAGVQPPFADRRVGPPMRLRCRKKEEG